MLISRETKIDIELSCPKCNQSLVVESKYMGQILPCPACVTDILVPAGAVKNLPEKNLLKTKEQPPEIEDGDSPERHPILQQAGNRKKKKFLDGVWKIPVFILVSATGVFVSGAIKKYYYKPKENKTETPAWLGEPLAKIKNHFGYIEIKDNSFITALFPDCGEAVIKNKESFDEIEIIFLRSDPKKECISVRYSKTFKKVSEINLGFKDAIKMLEKYFPQNKPALVMTYGFVDGKQQGEEWEASWSAENGAGALSFVKQGERGYDFSFSCHNKKFGELLRNKLLEEAKVDK